MLATTGLRTMGESDLGDRAASGRCQDSLLGGKLGMTLDTVFVSRLGQVLRERHLNVGELQRRLHARGHSISRGAIDRLVSERAVRKVELDVLVPLLEELGVSFHDAFARVPSEAVANREAARPAVAEAARRMASDNRRARLAEADGELDDIAARLERDLRSTHPELFDRRGRLRQRALSRLLLERFGGKRTITGDEVLALIHGHERTAPKGAA
jgi:Cro/C1-type HTH DNA-binding domain